MFDPTFNTRSRQRQRRGAILPMFALMLPVILVVCGLAINLAYVQLMATEMKVATDVTSHAAGRALSEAQRELDPNMTLTAQMGAIVQRTYDEIEIASKWNKVGGQELVVSPDDTNVHFGYSTRSDGGMYQFNFVPVGDILNGTHRASSVGVVGKVNLPLAFQAMQGMTSFTPERRSIATQVDRDIALVLDRSGSMLSYKDFDDLDETLEELYNDYVSQPYTYYYWWNGQQYSYTYTVTERRISYGDYMRGLGYYQWYGTWYYDGLYERTFSSDVRTEMNDLYGRSNEQAHLDMYEYMYDWETYTTTWNNGFKTQAPRHSRWAFLALGVEKFLDVLGGTTDGSSTGTDQKELVSLVTFDNYARVDTALTDDDVENGGIAYYQNIRDIVNDIVPLNGTGIGRGLETGLPPIIDPDWAVDNNMTGAVARPFAEKTIVVLTDGISNAGVDPVTATQTIVADNAVTIHTVTFTSGSDETAMKSVAEKGNGKHYHADTGEILIRIFEEVANNLPTILTE